METSGIFKRKYQSLRGSDWIRTIDPEDIQVFVDLGNQANDHGRMGGKARSATARRIKGKFVRADGTFTPLDEKRIREMNQDSTTLEALLGETLGAGELEKIGKYEVIYYGGS